MTKRILFALGIAALAACGGGGGGTPAPTPPTTNPPSTSNDPVIAFTDATQSSGLSRTWGVTSDELSYNEEFASGIAAADYDADGDIDLYVTGGELEVNHLYQNQGDGSFAEVGASLGVDVLHHGSGPNFSDYDGDGDLDLFVGSIKGDPYFLMENRDGQFVDVTLVSGIDVTVANTVSATFSDYDNDGDLDLFLSHWGAPRQADTETLWRNNGDSTFSSASIESGIAQVLIEPAEGTGLEVDRTFTPNLSDIDNDGDDDLLMAADLDASQVFINNGDATFTRVTDREVIIDQAGMGAAVGDFDNDGNLDLFHVNGWRGTVGPNLGRGGSDAFRDDQIRFFHAQGDGTFQRMDTSAGLTDKGQGRGVACFDAERDGDIDIVVTNNDEDQLLYYRNDSTNDNHYLGIQLTGTGFNTRGIGAWIMVTTSLGTQVREVRAGNNFVSQNPPEVHIGLGTATSADVVVTWPDGSETSMSAVAVDQLLTIEQN